jgi:hypothetical protein
MIIVTLGRVFMFVDSNTSSFVLHKRVRATAVVDPTIHTPL